MIVIGNGNSKIQPERITKYEIFFSVLNMETPSQGTDWYSQKRKWNKTDRWLSEISTGACQKCKEGNVASFKRIKD